MTWHKKAGSREVSTCIIIINNLHRADHPSNVKRGGICIYYKNCLPLKVANIQYLQESINFRVKIGKLCNFVALDRSKVNLKMNSKNLELNLDKVSTNNPFLTVVLGDFNANWNLWYKNDKTTYEGSTIDSIASQFGLHQLIDETTHLTRNTLLCIDLIFTSQPNLVMESGVHSSLQENCHCQITYAKFHLILYYHLHMNGKFGIIKGKHWNIRKAISEFLWERRFCK